VSGGGALPLKIFGIGRLSFVGLCWTYCNRFKVVAFPEDLSQFWEGHFGRLAGVPDHLKCLALVVYYSWDYVGHIATGFKWLPFQLI